ncbi:MAG: tetratricopeptide repeat protein [Chloroflexi bacterium]|nr:tetratricopeptide repeat protein [Chloroflexota bacterium]
MAAAILIPGGLGLLAGYQELAAQNHEAAITHFNRGLGYLAENYPELARSEFEIALRFDGSYEPAQQKLRELQPQANSTLAPAQDQVSSTLFDEAKTLVTQKQWSDAISRLEQLRTLNPDYRTVEVNDLRFQAYSGGGKAAVAAGQIELARERFESALAIRNTDRDVLRQRDLAVLYLDGQQAVGYNWKLAIQKFSTLYQQDPNYDDVKKRLFEAYIMYGDLAAKQGAPCLAVNQYDGALGLFSDTSASQKRSSSMGLCRQAITATATPPVLVGAENYIWKISTTTDRSCDGNGDVSGFVRDALGRLLSDVPIGYYADGITLVATRTNSNGQYQFVLGKDPGVFHLVILGPDGKTPSTLAADVQYPGGINAGCHIMVDWQRVQ